MIHPMASVGKPLFLGKNAAELAVELVETIAESNRQAAERKEARRREKARRSSPPEAEAPETAPRD